LSLKLPQAINADIFKSTDYTYGQSPLDQPVLEILELPLAKIDTAALTKNLLGFPLLRSLDLSETTVTGSCRAINPKRIR